ncbi:MAG: hypothetical protein K2N51_07475 [Lachnospiraceae bacterium]|nr:hypothetical protein [Lachnospiraceae bacterium]
MKKIAVISNIQSNLYALEKFLEYISDQPMEHIFNLGNFFDSDLFCCEIFDIISSDSRFINILGEKERKMLKVLDKNEENELEDDEKKKVLKMIDVLGEERVNILKKFPEKLEIECDHKKIFAGADTTDTRCVDYGCSEKKIAIMLLEEEVIDRNDLFSYDYILYGYHGLSEMEYFLEPLHKDRETCYISPGNLYMQHRGKIQFTIIELSQWNDIIQQNNIAMENSKIIHAIKNHNQDAYHELRKYGELNYVSKMEGNLNIHCCISEPFKIHSQYKEQYIELWRMLIDFCEKKCVRYYTSNLVNGDPELGSQEWDWTQEEREKVKVDFIDKDGNFAWHEMGVLDKNGEILFASCEFGEVYWLNGLDKKQMREIIDYLNSLPNSRKMIFYRLE